MSEKLSPELVNAALEFQTAEAADARKATAAVQAMAEDAGLVKQPAPAAPPSPAPAPQETASHKEVAVVVLVALDLAMQRLAGAHYALTESERAQLQPPLEACLAKYLPEVALGPEAALLGAAAFVYGPKFLAGPPAPPEPPKAQEVTQ